MNFKENILMVKSKLNLFPKAHLHKNLNLAEQEFLLFIQKLVLVLLFNLEVFPRSMFRDYPLEK